MERSNCPTAYLGFGRIHLNIAASDAQESLTPFLECAVVSACSAVIKRGIPPLRMTKSWKPPRGSCAAHLEDTQAASFGPYLRLMLEADHGRALSFAGLSLSSVRSSRLAEQGCRLFDGRPIPELTAKLLRLMVRLNLSPDEVK